MFSKISTILLFSEFKAINTGIGNKKIEETIDFSEPIILTGSTKKISVTRSTKNGK